jgi:CheY-like chemotaxis protein
MVALCAVSYRVGVDLFARRLRRAHPDLPVLMFTADPAATAEAKAATSARSNAAHYAGVIDKPFLVLEFLATLKHAVEKT